MARHADGTGSVEGDRPHSRCGRRGPRCRHARCSSGERRLRGHVDGDEPADLSVGSRRRHRLRNDGDSIRLRCRHCSRSDICGKNTQIVRRKNSDGPQTSLASGLISGKVCDPNDLSHPSLVAAARECGQLQLGTLGGGNHFVELQCDASGRLWAMVHTGSRAMGQTIRSHHLARATVKSRSLLAVDSTTDLGKAYLADQAWACRYAAANREIIGNIIAEEFAAHSVDLIESKIIRCDHNHVRQEIHFGRRVFVHRKGAMPADDGLPGVIPGSMGTSSYLVTGRGNAESLRSSAHGAGRMYSRRAARDRFGRSEVRRQMQGVWYDPRQLDSLREETPKAYKDLKAVMRAQEDLVRIDRVLRPVLVFKGN